jgi:hypothetical protein
VTLLDSIDRAGSVGDLTYVDLTYPLTGPGLTRRTPPGSRSDHQRGRRFVIEYKPREPR